MVCLVVSHGTAAADFQSAFGIQLPKCILAAASAGDDPHGNGTGNIGNAELFCIGLRIGVLTDGQCHIGDSVEEDVSADLDCAVGNIEAVQARISLENIFAHACKAAVFADRYVT